jgi:hypothetical protein
MIAIARVAALAIGATLRSEVLKQIALLCGAGLFVSLLLLTYGLDLSAGLF